MTAAASRLARMPSWTMNPKETTAAAPSSTTDSGAIPERPLPSSDSIGEAASPSAGVASQPIR